MAGLEAVLVRFTETHITGELWIDGSFLTQKIDPEDVDLLLRVQAEFCDSATSEQEEALGWFEEGLRDSFRCDSYIWREYPPGHDLHEGSEEDRVFWTKWFGKSRNGYPKGIAVIVLPDGAL